MRFLNLFYRQPDFCIGGWENPYMRRWWVLPRNRWFNIYLHNILRDDDDRALHDHPWASCSIVLRGDYFEHTPKGRFWRRPGSVVLRKAEAPHRLELGHDPNFTCFKVNVPAWTIFITGRRVREWGFHCPKGWRHWKDFVSQNDVGQVGKGCE